MLVRHLILILWLVGAVYWFVYLRRSAREEARRTTEREPQAR